MERTGMGKLVMQMAVTIALLGGICAWNLHRADERVAAMLEQGGVQLPVIMYHSILKDEARAGPYVLSPAALEADLDYLQHSGYETVTISELVDFVDGKGEFPEKPVLITFDDGFYNNYLYAYPLLAERDMQAVVSVIGEQTALYTESGQENAYWSYLSAGRLVEMQESGVFEIGNHSYDLHDDSVRKGCLKKRSESVEEYRKMLTDDIHLSQTYLAESGLTPPQCYAYPYGAYSDETEDILKEMGFRCTLTCEERINIISPGDPDSLFLLGRYNRPSGMSTTTFFEKAMPGEGS